MKRRRRNKGKGVVTINLNSNDYIYHLKLQDKTSGKLQQIVTKTS
ncbi:hypothetical protein AB751O23_AL_00170 [Chlamydiales bacterium SCGC AB-751-O23]|nr:hypothetical protein AB751O23_AL_00170 [Chlamydiales bacterium SCGC AB-751-O23]